MPTIDRIKRYWEQRRKTNESFSKDYSFYNKQAWRKLSRVYLRRHPLCCECEKENILTSSVHCDHIVPITKDKSKALKWENLQALCLSCHNKKSAIERNK